MHLRKVDEKLAEQVKTAAKRLIRFAERAGDCQEIEYRVQIYADIAGFDICYDLGIGPDLQVSSEDNTVFAHLKLDYEEIVQRQIEIFGSPSGSIEDAVVSICRELTELAELKNELSELELHVYFAYLVPEEEWVEYLLAQLQDEEWEDEEEDSE